MKSHITLLLAGSALVAVALTGCTATASPASNGGSGKAPAAASDIATASTKLGTVIVDGKGMTAYMFDKDVAGSNKSACTGGCAALWPAITTTSAKPTVKGVTGSIATIPSTGGAKQITVDGHPIYTFANDSSAGDIKGQGVGGIWWVLNASGTPVKKAATTSIKGY